MKPEWPKCKDNVFHTSLWTFLSLSWCLSLSLYDYLNANVFIAHSDSRSKSWHNWAGYCTKVMMHLATQEVAHFSFFSYYLLRDNPFKTVFSVWFTSFMFFPKNVFYHYGVWAADASAASESVYFHKSLRSINIEAWVWGCPFSCQVCRVLKSGIESVLFCTRARYSFSSGKDSPHFMSTRPFKLGNQLGKEKKKDDGNHHDKRLTDKSLPPDKEKKEKIRLMLQKQSSDCAGILPVCWEVIFICTFV